MQTNMNPIRQQHQDERGKCWTGMSWIWRFGDAIDQGRRHVLHALDVHMTRCSISVAVGISKICSVLSCEYSRHARYCTCTWITTLHRGGIEMQLLFNRPIVTESQRCLDGYKVPSHRADSPIQIETRQVGSVLSATHSHTPYTHLS